MLCFESSRVNISRFLFMVARSRGVAFVLSFDPLKSTLYCRLFDIPVIMTFLVILGCGREEVAVWFLQETGVFLCGCSDDGPNVVS